MTETTTAPAEEIIDAAAKLQPEAALPVPSASKLDLKAVKITSKGGGAMFMPQNMAECLDFATMMAKSDFAVPPKFRGNPGACLAILMQALRWEMDPFPVANKAYITKAKDGSERLAYEAQLVNAVVNTRAPIEGRLRYELHGEGGNRFARVGGFFVGDNKFTVLDTPTVAKIHPKNSPLWVSDTDQQLCYYGGRSWGRRYCPEVLMGVYTPEEIAQVGADDLPISLLAGAPKPQPEDFEPAAEGEKTAQAQPQAAAQAQTAAQPAAEAAKPEPAPAPAPGHLGANGPKGDKKATESPPPETRNQIAGIDSASPPVDNSVTDQIPADDEGAHEEADKAAEAMERGQAILQRGIDNLVNLRDVEEVDKHGGTIVDILKEVENLDPEDFAVLRQKWTTATLERKRDIGRKAKPAGRGR